VDHKEDDYAGKRGRNAPAPVEEIEQLARFRRVLERERAQPHRLGDLAVDGHDLIELGYVPGPALGKTLEELLKTVVDDPSHNTRDALLELARAKLGR
jgi:hypothetical protein